jgi:hypothetical protein
MTIDWTPDEDKTLMENFHKGAKYVNELLPRRNITGIYRRKGLLDVIHNNIKKTCRICGERLTPQNWYPASCERRDYICKKCIVTKNRVLTAKNPLAVKKYNTQNALHTTGEYHLVRKRPRPSNGSCELCKRIKPTVYHHYGEITEGMPLLGIWVCRFCHPFVELYDEGFGVVYEKIKNQILNGTVQQ